MSRERTPFWKLLLPALLFPTAVSAFLAEQVAPPAPEKLWALIIGVSNYTKAEPLKYAASDASSFGQFLSSPRGGAIPPEQTIALTEDQATRFNILVKLQDLQENVKRGDTVYLYMAGHGFITRKGIGYYVPSDGDLRLPGPTSVSFTVLKEQVELGLQRAGQRFLITDLCNSGRIGPETSELSAQIQNLINQHLLELGQGGRGSFLNLLASRPTEASWESDELGGGVFTYTLLEALNGKAVEEGRPVVPTKEVVDYVQQQVPVHTANQQHPMANEAFDPAFPLAYLDLPGPKTEKVIEEPTYLEIINAGEFLLVRYLDPATQADTIQQLGQESVQIGSLPTGELDLVILDKQYKPKELTVTIEPGRNVLNLAELGSGRVHPRAVEVASLSPSPAAPAAAQGVASAESADATLLMRLESGSDVFIDGDYQGASQSEDRYIQFRGLAPGEHRLRIVPSPQREHRFRVRLFSGPQIFDVDSGELRALAQTRVSPARAPLPPDIPPQAEQVYRRFLEALFEERLVTPDGNSAWDYFQQLRDLLPAPVLEREQSRLVVAMGNRAQRIILKYVRGGDVRWRAEVFEEGEALIERAQALFRETPELESQERFFAGRALIEQGRYNEAVPELQRSIALDDEASHAHNALGLAYWQQNRLDEAIPALEQALDLTPEWNYPRITLALTYLQMRRYQESEQTFRDAIQIDPEDSTAHRGLGQLQLLTNRLAEAEAELLEAIRMNPGNAYAHETLGQLYQLQQRSEEAEEMFRLAIRLEPDEPSFRISLGELLQQLGRQQDARGVFQQAADRHPGNTRVLERYGNLLLAQGRADQGEQLYRRAIAADPVDSNLHVSYGLFLQRKGDRREAEREFRRALDLDEKNAFAHYNLASLYLARRNLDRAEEKLEDAHRADPRLAATPMLVGRIRFAQERHLDALEHYRQALGLSIDPHQQQELVELIAQAEDALVQEGLEQARERIERRDYARAWSIYAETMRRVPESRPLRDAILVFQEMQPQAARVAALPGSRLRSVLETRFWSRHLASESLWAQGGRADSLNRFARALDAIESDELELLDSSAFNLGNRSHSIHRVVTRWAGRFNQEGRYQEAIRLMETAGRHRLFAPVPGVSPLTLASLLRPEDAGNPVRFDEFDVLHFVDRQAHAVYAAAHAGAGRLDRAFEYLAGLESERPDVEARTAVARTLRREGRSRQAIELLSAAMTGVDAGAERVSVDALVLLAELLCEAARCPEGRSLLERGRAVFPDNDEIRNALRRLR